MNRRIAVEEKHEQKSTGEREVLWTSENLYKRVDEAINWVVAPPFLPKEARDHLYNARREMMLAARTIIDKSLERLDESQRRQQNQPPTKIKVE
jgi:hypothetical protein